MVAANSSNAFACEQSAVKQMTTPMRVTLSSVFCIRIVSPFLRVATAPSLTYGAAVSDARESRAQRGGNP